MELELHLLVEIPGYMGVKACGALRERYTQGLQTQGLYVWALWYERTNCIWVKL